MPTPNTLLLGNFLEVAADWPDDCVDLVFTSPPYEDRRAYENAWKDLKGEEYVEWAKKAIRLAARLSRGLAVFVIDGKGNQGTYTATPEKIIADLHREGYAVWRTACYAKNAGTPGSGGTQGLKGNWEPVIQVCKRKGRLPWADNTACGEPCKYGPGGAFGNRNKDGTRAKDGKAKAAAGKPYIPPKLANPGNMVFCKTGGGNIGHKLAHENEAPFPEALAEMWVRSYCPPGGVVLDPFCGGGTTVCVARKFGRKWIGIDLRQSQLDLTTKRMQYYEEILT